MLGHPAFDLDWNLVRTFVAVARAGSLAAGARVLGITHPTAARHVQSLEEALGFSLFTRTAKGLVLNEMGERLQASAHDMHDCAMAFQSHTERLRTGPVNRVRLGVAEILAELLPDIMLGEVDDQHDDVCVDMIVTNDLLNLLQRDADMALRHVRPDQQELFCRRLGSLSMGVFASSTYIEKNGLLIEGSMDHHRFVDGLSKQFLVQGAAKRGMIINHAQVAFRSDSVACQRAAVSSGWGVGAFPLWMAAGQKDWRSVFATEEVIELDVWLVARPEVRHNQQLKGIFSRLGEAVQACLAA